ncbi:MAG: FAD-dependent oxidoreductase, partial [Steroidobacteraceae bacterium]
MKTHGKQVAVIGGGMAGMAAAHRLKQLGCIPTVFEARDRVGGRMWSIKKGDFLMDVGMSAYLGTYREAIELITELGLRSQMSELPALGATMRDGKRYHFDYTKPISTSLSTAFLSWPDKFRALRLALDTFRHRASLGYSDYTKLAEIDIETVEHYAKRRLNHNLHHYVAQPLVSGTWVADDKDTSIALLYWTVRNMLAPFVYNLNQGVMALPVEISKHIEVRYKSPVEHVADTGAAVEVTAGGRTSLFDGCVIATTAEPALAMYPQMDATTRDLYRTTRYRKLGNVGLGLSSRPSDPATYYLPSPHEDPDTIAVIADHNKAPYRAPDGKALFTVLLSHEY